MAKIYDENGNKMSLQEIGAELIEKISTNDAKRLSDAIEKYEFKDSQMKLAHGILDTYKYIDGSTENGARVRKLMDSLMTKYQKSTVQASADMQSQYNFIISELAK